MHKLSICFTVYNQSGLLAERLGVIIPAIMDRTDVEIVISDDCSSENIEGLVARYNSDLLHYYRTPYNLGHDLNILHAIEHAESDYVMVLRTRDCLYVDNIDSIIKELNTRVDYGYVLFSAVDENGHTRLNLENKTYFEQDAAKAHFSLFVHPSGNIYNKKYLNLAKYRSYIEQYFDNIYGFSVHELIRCDLSTKSAFRTSGTIGWVYSDTLSSKDIAVNSSKSKTNVYAPEFGYPRYKCYLNFVVNEVPDHIKDMYINDAIHRYYYTIIARAKTIANDKRYNFHYNSNPIKISRREVARKMNGITEDVLSQSGIDTERYEGTTKKETRRCVYFYSCYEKIRNMLINTPVYEFYRRCKEGRKTTI